MRQPDLLTLLFTGLGGLALLFLVAPLAGLLLQSSVPELVETIRDKEVCGSIFLSLWTAMGATFLFGTCAVPLAWLLARKDFPGKKTISAIIDLPLMIPHSAAGIALLTILSRHSLLGQAAGHAGISFIGSPAGIMAAMAFVSLPFLINSARTGFEAVDERLEKTAMNLGASSMRAFFTITLPLAWRAVIAGTVLMFGRGMSEFGAVIIVAYHPITAPVLIYERFGAFGLRYARPAAIVFIGICLVVFVILRVLAEKNR
jgi:molybdate/tungstate transport system permease protein